jgi:hypothetical protein
MFNNLRKSIANFINPVHTTFVPAGQRELTYGKLPQHMATQHERVERVNYKGSITPEFLPELVSEYLRDQIALSACWSAMREGFDAHVKSAGHGTQAQKRILQSKVEKAVETYHAWNAAISSKRQQGEDETLEILAKLCMPRARKSSPEAVAIIAAARGISVKELTAQREKEAKLAQATATAHLEQFNQLLWQSVTHACDATMNGQFAIMKAEQTIQFVGTSWTGDDNSISAELLLMKGDLALLKQQCKEVANNDRFIEGVLTSDGMMSQNTKRQLDETRSDTILEQEEFVSKADLQAFRDWQAEQAA